MFGECAASCGNNGGNTGETLTRGPWYFRRVVFDSRKGR